MLVFSKHNANYTDRQTNPFKFLNMVNEICTISLLFRLTNFRSTMIKFYLIGSEDDNLNNTPKTKYNNQKNSHEKDYLPIIDSIIVDLISILIVIQTVTTDLLIGLPNNHDYKVVLFLLAKENSS